MHKPHLFALAAAALFAATSAQAVDYSYSGSTVGAPTFNRPVSSTELSLVGTEVAYDAFSFTVSTSGIYSFLSTADFDNFTLLYSPAFVPTASLTNLVALNDDFGSFVTSGFSQSLTAGTPYVFITTGFDNFDEPAPFVGVGNFSNVISGPGVVIPGVIPEPGTYALMGLGLALVGGLARRRMTSH